MDHDEERAEHVETTTGDVRIEQWRRDGRLHRTGGPAYVEVRADGSQSMGWYREGKLYRADGPAWIDRSPLSHQCFDGAELQPLAQWRADETGRVRRRPFRA